MLQYILILRWKFSLGEYSWSTASQSTCQSASNILYLFHIATLPRARDELMFELATCYNAWFTILWNVLDLSGRSLAFVPSRKYFTFLDVFELPEIEKAKSSLTLERKLQLNCFHFTRSVYSYGIFNWISPAPLPFRYSPYIRSG